MVRTILAYLAAVVVTTVIAAAASTQFVLAELAALGVAVPLDVRLTTTAHDIVGMFPLYGGILAVGFAIALPVARLLARRWPGGRAWLHALAGASAVLAAIYAMKLSFGITTIAGARSVSGLIAQALAGAAGGALFARLTRRSSDES